MGDLIRFIWRGSAVVDTQAIIELTADIVASHVSNNNVSVSNIPGLITSVHHALAGLDGPTTEQPIIKTPFVSVRASIKPDYLSCLECGKKQKTIRRHLMTAHGLTPEQYRSDFGLGRDYPLVAPTYSEQRRNMAKSFGLGRKPKSSGANGAAASPKKKAKPASNGRRKPASNSDS